MAKKANKGKDQNKQAAKKVRNIFTVSKPKKTNLKKPKAVPVKLKKIAGIQDKREKIDKNFQSLHSAIVSKKQPKQLPAKPLPLSKKSKPDTKKMETDLDKLKMA